MGPMHDKEEPIVFHNDSEFSDKKVKANRVTVQTQEEQSVHLVGCSVPMITP